MRAKSVKIEVVFFDKNGQEMEPVSITVDNCNIDMSQSFDIQEFTPSWDGKREYVHSGRMNLEMKVST